MQENDLLEKLEKMLRDGTLTPVGKWGADSGTLVCYKEQIPIDLNGTPGYVYFQEYFEQIPLSVRLAFKGAQKGHEIGPFKVLAVYDVWTDVKKETA